MWPRAYAASGITGSGPGWGQGRPAPPAYMNFCFFSAGFRICARARHAQAPRCDAPASAGDARHSALRSRGKRAAL
jgi:hypothetical protein